MIGSVKDVTRVILIPKGFCLHYVAPPRVANLLSSPFNYLVSLVSPYKNVDVVCVWKYNFSRRFITYMLKLELLASQSNILVKRKMHTCKSRDV